MPHYCVHKTDNTTTKLRLVSDADAKTWTLLSSNDCLLVGSKLQDNLLNNMNRFHFFMTDMNACIAKICNQGKLQKNEIDCRHFFDTSAATVLPWGYHLERLAWQMVSERIESLNRVFARICQSKCCFDGYRALDTEKILFWQCTDRCVVRRRSIKTINRFYRNTPTRSVQLKHLDL